MNVGRSASGDEETASDITPLARRGAAALASSMGGGGSEGQREIESKIISKIAAIVQPNRHNSAFAQQMQSKACHDFIRVNSETLCTTPGCGTSDPYGLQAWLTAWRVCLSMRVMAMCRLCVDAEIRGGGHLSHACVN